MQEMALYLWEFGEEGIAKALIAAEVNKQLAEKASNISNLPDEYVANLNTNATWVLHSFYYAIFIQETFRNTSEYDPTRPVYGLHISKRCSNFYTVVDMVKYNHLQNLR